MKIKYYILVFVILFPFRVYGANEMKSVCNSNGYTISTVNGIFTDEEEARSNQRSLRVILGIDYKGQPLDYQYLYNPTHIAGLNDFIDAVQQGVFNQKSDYDLVKMIKDASEKVKTQKLLLVAHSQGNFYANNFYDKVASQLGGVPKESMGVYGVGSPANQVAGGGKYLTSDTDDVIANLVARHIKILKPNVHIPLSHQDGNGHSFGDVYLKHQGERIVSDIKQALGRLRENDKQASGEPCISSPELSVLHKMQGLALAVADPAATVVKTGAAASYDMGVYARDFAANTGNTLYNLGAYIRDGAANTGIALGNVINKTSSYLGSSIKYLVRNLGANVAGSLPGAADAIGGRAKVADAENTPTSQKQSYAQNEIANILDNKSTEGDNSRSIKNNESETETKNSKIAARVLSNERGRGGGRRDSPEEDSGPIGDEDENQNPEDGQEEEPKETTDTTSPVITLLGNNPLNIIKGENYADPGATALDETDGVISVMVTGTVNSTFPGDYLITYTATDLAGNTASFSRTIAVLEPTSELPEPDPEPEPEPTPEPEDHNLYYSDLNENGKKDSEETEVTVVSSKTLPAGEYGFKNLTVSNNAVLTLLGDELSSEEFKGVKIIAQNVTIQNGSSISANSQGYKDGPGAPRPDSFAGASYGGRGERSDALPIYGSAILPTELGSGGTSNNRGGGAIWLQVSDTLSNKGLVSANGDQNSSGGSIYITAENLEGSGKFIANGGGLFAGSNLHGSGGGGRILVNYKKSSWTGTAEAKGGCGNYNASIICAGDGTSGLVDSTNNDLYVPGSWLFQKNDQPVDFRNIKFDKGAKIASEKDINISAQNLFIDNGTQFLLGEDQGLNIDHIHLSGSSTLALSKNANINARSIILTGNSIVTANPEQVLYLEIDSLEIGAGSSVLANGKGYIDGPGAPSSGSVAGASYGGTGGGNVLASLYGSEYEPTDFGSGGINNFRGGGAIRIIADILTNNGIIAANGEATSSGGSVYVTAKNITGSGSFSANGGNSHLGSVVYGAGGGGRVAIYYEAKSFTGQATANGATSSVRSSKPGTVKWVDITLPLPDIKAPAVSDYSLNGSMADTTADPKMNPVALSLTASENVNWLSVRIEKENDANIYKIFQSGAGCVDGTDICTKTWDGALSGGGQAPEGTYNVKVNIKDNAGNEFSGYLPHKIIVDVPEIQSSMTMSESMNVPNILIEESVPAEKDPGEPDVEVVSQEVVTMKNEDEILLEESEKGEN